MVAPKWWNQEEQVSTAEKVGTLCQSIHTPWSREYIETPAPSMSYGIVPPPKKNPLRMENEAIKDLLWPSGRTDRSGSPLLPKWWATFVLFHLLQGAWEVNQEASTGEEKACGVNQLLLRNQTGITTSF